MTESHSDQGTTSTDVSRDSGDASGRSERGDLSSSTDSQPDVDSSIRTADESSQLGPNGSDSRTLSQVGEIGGGREWDTVGASDVVDGPDQGGAGVVDETRSADVTSSVGNSSSEPSVDQRDKPDVSSGSDFESSSESAHFDTTQDDHISDGAAPSLEDLTNAVQESFEGSDPGALPSVEADDTSGDSVEADDTSGDSVEADDTSGDSADLGSQLLAQNVGPKAENNSGTSGGTFGYEEPGSGNSAGSSDHSLEEVGADFGQTAASSVAGELKLGPSGEWAAGEIGKAIGGLVGSVLDVMLTPTGQPDEPGRAPDAVGQAAGMSAAGTYGTGGVSKAAPEQNQSTTPDAEGVTTVPTEGGQSTQ